MYKRHTVTYVFLKDITMRYSYKPTQRMKRKKIILQAESNFHIF